METGVFDLIAFKQENQALCACECDAICRWNFFSGPSSITQLSCRIQKRPD